MDVAWICAFCDAVMGSYESLWTHLLMHYPKRYWCPHDCDFGCYVFDHFKGHLKSFHGVTELETFVCGCRYQTEDILKWNKHLLASQGNCAERIASLDQYKTWNDELHQNVPAGCTLIPLSGLLGTGCSIAVPTVMVDMFAGRTLTARTGSYPYDWTAQDSIHRVVYSHMNTVVLDSSTKLDHRNGNRLDADIANLRIATDRQNARNRGVRRYAGKTSRYTGVDWSKHNKKWRARIQVDNGKNKSLGYYVDETDAAVAYNNEAIKRDYDFHRLNKIVFQN